jgi:hypothetical protein
MARKQLIKGANATKVEERISIVPQDIPEGQNIFSALKRFDEEGAVPKPATARSAAMTVQVPPESLVLVPAAQAPVPAQEPGHSAAARNGKPKRQTVSSSATSKKAEGLTVPVPGKGEGPEKARAGTQATKKAPPVLQPARKPKPGTVNPPIFRLPSRADSPKPRRAETRTVSPMEPQIDSSRHDTIPTEPSPPPKPEKGGSTRSISLTRRERQVIVKCCREYRNMLPIYLKSVQYEVDILDAIIEKCSTVPQNPE